MADMQQTLSLILSAKDEASTVLKQVGDQVAALGQQAERIMAGSEGIGLKVERPDAIKAALAKQLEVVTQSFDAQIAEEKKKEAVITQTAETGRQARYKVTQQEMLEAALARERDLQSAQNWAEKQNKILAQEQERQKALLSGPHAQVMFGDDQIRAIEEANAKANAVIQQQNKAGLTTMVSDANAAYRARVNAAEDAKDHELANIAATEAAQRTTLQTTVSTLQGQKEQEVTIWKAAAETQQRLIRETAEAAKVLAQGEADGAKQAAQQTAQAWAEEADRVKTLAQASSRLQKQMAQEVAQSERDAAEATKKVAADQAQAVKEATARSKEYAKSFKDLKEAAEGAFGPVGHLVEMGRQMLVWGIGYQAVMSVYSAATQAAGGLITTNVQLEQLSMTFSAIYQKSETAGRAMVTWLDTFAAKVPGTREEVRKAALSFAAAGDNVQQILPAASNLAAIMGVDLPTAAHAMVDAQMGRFEMLQVTLNTTKEALKAYGLEVDKVGHVTSGTFVPAIERYVAMRFGEHVQFGTQTLKTFQQQLQTAGMHTGATSDLLKNAAMVQAGTLPLDATGTQKQAVLGQTVNALHQAQMGNISSLHTMYGVTIADLDKIDKGWQATGTSAEQAFIKWYAATHGGMVALQSIHEQQSAIELQMQTLGGAWSNVQDSLTNLQQILGKGMFDVLKKQVGDLYNVLQSPAMAIFAHQLGSVLGDALQNVITGFKQWYAAIGGLPGLLHLLTTVGRDAWAVVQGLGNAFKAAWDFLSSAIAVFQPVLSALGLIGDRSRDGAGAIRFLTQAVVELFLAFKASQVVWAVLATFTAIAGTIERVKAAATQAALAQRALAASQTEVAASAAAETIAETASVGALDTVSKAAAAGTRLPSGIILPAGATRAAGAAGAATAGEEVAVAGAGAAESVGVLEMATAGLGAMGAAALTTLGPLALVVGGLAALAYGASKAKEAFDTAQQQEKIKPFLLPKDVTLPSPTISMANALVAGAFGGAMSGTNPAATGITESPNAAFLRTLPPNARTLYAQADQGTGTALVEHERAWLEYLSGHPKALKRLDAMLKAAHSPEWTMPQVQQALQGIRQQAAGYSQNDVDAAAKAKKQALELLNADVKNRPLMDVSGQVQALQDATYQVALTQGKSIDEAVKESTAVEKQWVKDHWKKLTQTTKDELTQQGLAPGAPPGSQTGTVTADTLQQNIQEYQTALQSSEALGRPFTVLRDGIDAIAQTMEQQAHQALGATAQLTDQQLVALSQDIQQVFGSMPDEVLKPFTQVQADFAALASTLRRDGLKPDEISTVLAAAWANYYSAKIANLKKQLQDDIIIGTVPVATELGTLDTEIANMRKSNAVAAAKHVKTVPFSDADMLAAHQEGLKTIYTPLVQSAELQLQYDEKMKAPWNTIVADLNTYADNLGKSGEKAQTVSLNVAEKTEAAAQAWLQTDQGLLQYSADMGATWSVLLGHIKDVQTDMERAHVPSWQIAQDVGNAIKTNADTLLQGAMDTGSSLNTMQGIIREGAQALRDAGWSRIAVEKWITAETKKALEPLLQQQRTAGQTGFDLAVQRGQIQTPQQVMAYANAQMVLARQMPLQPGETQAEFNMALQKDQNDLLKTGFTALLKNATDQFDYDKGVAHPSLVQLQKDTKQEIALLGIELKKGLISPLDYKLLVQQANKSLADAFGGTAVGQAPPPQYGRVSPFSSPTAYGSSTAYFGAIGSRDPNAALISRLEAQLATQRTIIQHLEAQLSTQQKIEHNTMNTADFSKQLVDYLGHPIGGVSPLSAASRVRGGGGFMPKSHN